MFLLPKHFLFIIFKMLQQLNAFVFVDKILDAFDHTFPEIICRVFSFRLRLFEAYIILSSSLIAYFLHNLSFQCHDFHLFGGYAAQIRKMSLRFLFFERFQIFINSLKFLNLSFYNILKLYSQIPLFIRFLLLEEFFTILDQRVY